MCVCRSHLCQQHVSPFLQAQFLVFGPCVFLELVMAFTYSPEEWVQMANGDAKRFLDDWNLLSGRARPGYEAFWELGPYDRVASRGSL